MSLVVKNYYALPLDEVQTSVNYMREWLAYHYGNPNTEKVYFALKVALNALEIIPQLEKDPFLRLVVEIFCPPPAN